MRLIHIRHITILFVVLLGTQVLAQDNVGIGLSNPHPSAILEISDSSRGVLIPRTDTNAVMNYVNGLTPNPGIADGLMIMDTNLNTYVYWDDMASSWKTLIGLVGPTGPKGFQGPRGPIGPTGLNTNWRDSSGFDQKVLKEDTCGDWFLDTQTGKVWRMWCDTMNGPQPRRWIDTVSYDNYWGELVPPDERVVVLNMHGTDDVSETMANDTAIVSMVPLDGLTTTIVIDRDEVAYIWAAGFGTTSKLGNTSDMAYAQYDLTAGGQITGNFYRDRLMQHIVTIGPDGPPSNMGLNDFVGWNLSGNFFLEGPKSPFPCGPCGPAPACTSCTPLNHAATVSVFGGNRFSGSAGTTVVILSDETTKENVGHLVLFAIIRRNPGTWPWKQ